MNETKASLGRREALKQSLLDALEGTGLLLLSPPESGRSSHRAKLKCSRLHEFERVAASICKWKSPRCPICASEEAVARNKRKLPDPNELDWLPHGLRLSRGVKPRDLRFQRFGRLLVTKVVGRHASRSLLWECRCDCGMSVVKKSSSLCLGKATSCGCLLGTTKKYKTIAPNKGKRYTIKERNEVFSSRKAWSDAVKLACGDQCEICGWNEGACDVHHRVARHQGGKNTVENGIVLCPNHHRIAHEKGLEFVLSKRSAGNDDRLQLSDEVAARVLS